MISGKVWKQADLSIFINDKKLSGVYEFKVGDVDKKTYLTINRYVVDGSEGLINEMRSTNFSIKLVNKASHNGYGSDVASVYSFEMGMKVDDNGDQLLRQIIVVSAANFIYTDKKTEEEDTQKLIQVLKEQQDKAKGRIPTAVINTEPATFEFRDGQSVNKDMLELALKKMVQCAKTIEEITNDNERDGKMNKALDEVVDNANSISRSRPPVEVSDNDLTWSNVRKPEEVADFVPTRKLESKTKKQ